MFYYKNINLQARHVIVLCLLYFIETKIESYFRLFMYKRKFFGNVNMYFLQENTV